MASRAFSDRFFKISAQKSALSVGFDPSVDILKKWGLPETVDGLKHFTDIMLESITATVGIIKPQSAFYEQFGWEGIKVLSETLLEARRHNILTILDAKRGDIGSINDAYARAYLYSDSPIRADSLTLSAYLGIEALKDVMHTASDQGTGVFVVVRSSNPEGASFQNAELASGEKIHENLCRVITEFNTSHLCEGYAPIGAVIGATLEEGLDKTLNALPHSLILCPGIGAQGATFKDVKKNFAGHLKRVIPHVGRQILAAGPSVMALKDMLKRQQDEAFTMVN